MINLKMKILKCFSLCICFVCVFTLLALHLPFCMCSRLADKVIIWIKSLHSFLQELATLMSGFTYPGHYLEFVTFTSGIPPLFLFSFLWEAHHSASLCTLFNIKYKSIVQLRIAEIGVITCESRILIPSI